MSSATEQDSKQPVDIKPPKHSEIHCRLRWFAVICSYRHFNLCLSAFEELLKELCRISGRWALSTGGAQLSLVWNQHSPTPACSPGWDFVLEQGNLGTPPQLQPFSYTTSSFCHSSENPAYRGGHQNLHRCQVLHRLHENHLVPQVSPQKYLQSFWSSVPSNCLSQIKHLGLSPYIFSGNCGFV